MICEIVLGLFIFFIVLLIILFLFRKRIQQYIIKKVMAKAMNNIMGGMLK